MTLAELVPLAINVSMGLIVFALGLPARFDEVTLLLRRPGLLLRSVLAMNVVMTIVAISIALTFDLHPAVKIALGVLALSPVPPVLPGKMSKAGGRESYIVSMLVSLAALSIVIVPLGVVLISLLPGARMMVFSGGIIRAVLVSVIIPLAAGLIVNRLAPELAQRIARPTSIFATVLLVVSFIPVLLGIWPMLVGLIGNGTLIALAAFAIVGVAVGHYLGVPRDSDRTVLAMATSTRHPGVAMAIAAGTFPEVKEVIAVVLWHLIVGAVVCIPYVNWRNRADTAMEPK